MFDDIYRAGCHLCSSRCSAPSRPQRWHTAGGSATPVEGQGRSKVKRLANAVGHMCKTVVPGMISRLR